MKHIPLFESYRNLLDLETLADLIDPDNYHKNVDPDFYQSVLDAAGWCADRFGIEKSSADGRLGRLGLTNDLSRLRSRGLDRIAEIHNTDRNWKEMAPLCSRVAKAYPGLIKASSNWGTVQVAHGLKEIAGASFDMIDVYCFEDPETGVRLIRWASIANDIFFMLRSDLVNI